jgi:hypothetical protein
MGHYGAERGVVAGQESMGNLKERRRLYGRRGKVETRVKAIFERFISLKKNSLHMRGKRFDHTQQLQRGWYMVYCKL